MLVRRLRRAVCPPLRHLRIRLVAAALVFIVEVSRCHGAVAGHKPPFRQEVGVAADVPLAKAVDGAPLGEHLPPIAQEGTAACRVAAVQSTR